MNCFHGALKPAEAAERLRCNRQDMSYLVRESHSRMGQFIVTYIKSETVKHFVIPTEAKHFHDSILDTEHLVASWAHVLQHPVPPPSPVTSYWRPGLRDPASLTCSVCSLEFEDQGRLKKHEKSHAVYECMKCQKCFESQKISHHRKICGKESAAPSVLSCDHPGCGFTTSWKSNLTVHKGCVT